MAYDFEARLKDVLRAGPDVPQRGLVNTFDTADLVLHWASENGFEPKLTEVLKMVEIILAENARKDKL